MNLPAKGNIKLPGGGRNWIILVFSLLLAFFMWSVMKLSNRYSSYVRYRIEVTTSIPGRKNVAVSEDVLVIGAKSTGFHILQNISGKENAPLLLEDVDSRFFHKYEQEGDVYYLLPDNLKQKIQDVFGSDMQVESFATDTLFFSFPVQQNRKVPVVASSVVSYGKQYMPYGTMTLKPDSILIYGDEVLVSQVEQVTTRAIKSNGADGPISGVVELNPVQGIRFSTDEVFYSQEIGRFVEHTVKVPVTIADAPSYANVAVVPQEVTIRYRRPFGSSASFTSQDFAVTVGYDEILRRDVVKPAITRQPEGILKLEIEPKFVECVL